MIVLKLNKFLQNSLYIGNKRLFREFSTDELRLNVVRGLRIREDPRIETAVPLGSHSAKIFFNNRICDFNYTWLKDNCQCPSCKDPKTGLKTLDAKALDINIRPQSLDVLPTGELKVVWPNDHSSVYDVNWLYKHGANFNLGNFELKESRRPTVQLWDNCSFKKNVPELSIDKVIDDDQILKQLLQNVHIYGFTIIKNVNDNHCVAKIINQFGSIKDVLNDSKTEMSFYQDLHTDVHLPNLQVRHFLDSYTGSTRLVIVDGYNIAKWIQLNHTASSYILSSTPVQFNIKTKQLSYYKHTSIFKEDNNGEVKEIYFNNQIMGPLQANSQMVLPFYHSYKLFCDKLQEPRQQLEFQLESGDLLIFNNKRIMNKILDNNSFWKDYYVEIEEAMSKYDHLMSY